MSVSRHRSPPSKNKKPASASACPVGIYMEGLAARGDGLCLMMLVAKVFGGGAAGGGRRRHTRRRPARCGMRPWAPAAEGIRGRGKNGMLQYVCPYFEIQLI